MRCYRLLSRQNCLLRALFFALALFVGLRSSFSATNTVILDWTGLMLDANREDNTGPTLSSRNLAILHTANFDAVNSIEGGFQPYMVSLAPAPGASSEAAAVAAAHKVMEVLYPTFSADIENMYN